MPDDQPQQPPDEDQPDGERDWLDDEAELNGLVLVPGDEPVPAGRVLLPEPAGPGDGVGGGLCWSFGVDLDAILAAAAKGMPCPGGTGMPPGLAGTGRGSTPARDAAASPGSPAPGPGQAPDDPSLDPAGPGGVLLPDEGGLAVDVVAEYLPGSAGLAAWLDQRDPAEASDYDLPAVAAGWRRVAAWAQAREFAAIAQIAARSAARNDKAGLEEDGRPSAVTPDAAAQVGLALALSPGTAEWWTGQAVTLTWRLPATGAALGAGEIDAYRARLIIEATSLLDEDTARRVEDDVLPEAGELTYAQLRARLRKAVIIADPQGAEDRRKAAERRARVSLYPDDDGTATLTGTSLPAPHAAAAMARITALARALKASGAGGGTDLLRAHIYLGLLLGTLPPIPPPADTGQPDEPTDDDPPDDGGGSGGAPGDGHPGGPLPRDGQHPRPPRGSRPPHGGQRPSGPPPDRDRSPGSPAPRCDEPAGASAGDPPPGAPRPGSPRGDAQAPLPDPGPPGTGPPSSGPPSSGPPSSGPPSSGPPSSGPPSSGPLSGSPDPGSPPASESPEPRLPGTAPPGAHPPDPRPPGPHPPGPEPPGASPAPATSPSDALPGSGTPGDDDGVHGPWPEVPPLTDADAPHPDESHADPPPEPDDDDRLRYGEDPLDLPDTGPIPAWPSIPGTTGTSPLTAVGTGASGAPDVTTGTGTACGQGRPGAGMLDLTLSWATFAEHASAPGLLGRIGPVTATQARALAAAASTAPGTRWRVILTDHHGHAITTAAITRRTTTRARPAGSSATRTGKAPAPTTTRAAQAPATQDPAGSPGTTGTTGSPGTTGTTGSPGTTGPMLPLAGPHASITGRVCVTIPAAALNHINAAELAGTSTRAAVLRTAAKAAARTRRQATADQQADAGCAHTTASPSYRPPATIRDLIDARDQTCRLPGCRQPAWRGDLDHTTPYHRGGLTCPCNLGPLCRRHHRLKQQHHWALTQTTPGTFHWQTPAGRTYATTPPRHAP